MMTKPQPPYVDAGGFLIAPASPGLLRGNNTLTICPATMMAVIEEWLSRELATPVEVTKVWANNTDNVFEIKFKASEERP